MKCKGDATMSDDRFGIVVSARDAWANAEELRALGARCVRTVVYDLDHLEVALANHPPDVRVIAVLDTRHSNIGRDLGDLSRWQSVVRAFGERFAGRVWALECMSAWDVLGIEAGTAVTLARRAGQILRDADAQIHCLLGSVAGPRWVDRLQEVARQLTPADRDAIDGACFQPNKKNARGFPGFDHRPLEHGEIDVSVQDAHDIVELPIWVTEFGLRLVQAGGEPGQALYLRNAFDLLRALPASVLAAATYHCWWDPAGGPHQRGEHAFGLRREDVFDADANTMPRLAWHAFARAAGGTGVPPSVLAPQRQVLARECA